MAGHIVPLRTYVLVFAALVGLTLLTIGSAYVDLGGSLNEILALTIAFTKASLVVLFFMHVRYSSQLTKLAVAAGVFWLVGILIPFLMSDYATRDWLPAPPAWETTTSP